MDSSADAVQRVQGSTDDAPLRWLDGRGRTWTIDAQPQGIRLDCDGDGFDIPRARFATDVYLSPMATEAVVRFCGPDDEVGFLVSGDQADELQRRIEAIAETPDALAEREVLAAQERRSMWPKMTAWSVWALMAASLAFVPFVGVAFAGLAVLLLLGQRKHLQDNASWRHVRWMGRITIAWMLWGLAVCALGSWTWMHTMDEAALAGGALGADFGYNTTAIVLALMVVIISLSVHEAAHAITAWWCGDDLARSLGRVTLNPLAHIDPFGTVVLPLLLVWMGGAVFGFARPVPVRLSGIRRFRRAHILISIAGPGSNLLLAMLASSLLLTASCLLRVSGASVAELFRLTNLFEPFVQLSGFAGASVLAVLLCGLKLAVLINVFLAMFNLIPVPPLDGSWVLEHMFPNSLGRLYAAIRPYGFILFLGLLYSGFLQPLLLPAVWAIVFLGEMLRACVIGI